MLLWMLVARVKRRRRVIETPAFDQGWLLGLDHSFGRAPGLTNDSPCVEEEPNLVGTHADAVLLDGDDARLSLAVRLIFVGDVYGDMHG